jgi:hypothetical protein
MHGVHHVAIKSNIPGLGRFLDGSETSFKRTFHAQVIQVKA